MTTDNADTRLTRSERMMVVSTSLGFVVTTIGLVYLFWTYNPIQKVDQILDGFWEPISLGRRRLPKGVIVLASFLGYFVFLPFAFLVFATGVVHGLRGKRTRLARWILRGVSHEAGRISHEQVLTKLEAEGRLRPGEKTLHRYLSPVAGWAIFLAFLTAATGLVVWVAMRD